MTKPMTPAQMTQQANRDEDGQYGTRTNAEAAGGTDALGALLTKREAEADSAHQLYVETATALLARDILDAHPEVETVEFGFRDSDEYDHPEVQVVFNVEGAVMDEDVADSIKGMLASHSRDMGDAWEGQQIDLRDALGKVALPAGVDLSDDAASVDGPSETEAVTVDIPVHEFYDSGEAYDATQTRDDIHDGDLISVPNEGIVGFLYEAWPVAVSENKGHLHSITDKDKFLADNPTYADSWAAAEAKIARDAAE